jgi:hypothetical protein
MVDEYRKEIRTMEKCVICGKDAIVKANDSWLCEKHTCHEQFFSIDRTLKNLGTAGDGGIIEEMD